ncbi:MAG TPA: SurA N-terminal domain-containing protein [Hyphomicrobiaceae bacterium]|nr:SurA N-terminal domain-containing protein [Hyphomicrobiaceae bacterium]
MHQLVPRQSLAGVLLASVLAMTSLPGVPAAQTSKAQTGKAQTAAVEKQSGQSSSKAGSQSIVALVNDEPVTAYEIEQRARFLSLSANIGDKVKENFKRLAELESTNQQLRTIMQGVVDSNKGKSPDQLRAIFDEKKKQFSMNLERQAIEGARSGLVPQMRKGAQEELIEERLKLQEAKKNGIEVSDDEVRRVLKGLADNNKMTEEQFVQHLKGLGVDATTLKERFRAMIGWREVIRRRFSALVSVTQREIDRAVSASGGEAGDDGVELHVQKITLSMPTASDQAGMAKRFAEAEALRRKFGGCKTMAGLAKDAPGLKFEDMKFIKPSSISEPTRSLLLSAKDGDMLPPSAVPGAIDLMAVCARRTVKGDEKQREKVQEDLRAKEFEMLAKRHLRDIRQDAHIEFR